MMRGDTDALEAAWRESGRIANDGGVPVRRRRSGSLAGASDRIICETAAAAPAGAGEAAVAGEEEAAAERDPRSAQQEAFAPPRRPRRQQRASGTDADPTGATILPAACNVRALVSCWCAYERRWVQAEALSPPTAAATAAAGTAANNRQQSQQQQQKATTKKKRQQKTVEALLVDEDFELELANFHALIVRGVAAEAALAWPRASLEARVSEWPGADARIRSWWLPREDVTLACLADLQLVVPGVWIGSAFTLQHADAVAQPKIAHVVHCATVTMGVSANGDESESESESSGGHASISPSSPQPPPPSQAPQRRATPVVAQVAASPLRTALAYTVTLSELPRLAFLRCKREAATREGAIIPETWRELEAASRFLLELSRLHDKVAASTSLSLDDADAGDSGDGTTDSHCGGGGDGAVDMGLLLYCDSGVSTSVAVGAALLMYRFCLPLAHALLLLRTARRFVAPSAYLQHQLELFEAELQQRRRGSRLPLHRQPM